MSKDDIRPEPGEIYLECTFVGDCARVAAVDAATGTEVVVFGPVNASRADLELLAVRKLKKQMQDALKRPPDNRPGRLA